MGFPFRPNPISRVHKLEKKSELVEVNLQAHISLGDVK